MGLFDKLSGSKKTELDERIREISRTLINKAKSQAEKYGLNVTLEAKRIGEMTGILKEGMFSKKHHPAYFVDIAMWLLCYPPELAFIIATHFTGFAPGLGWNPFGTIMVALGQIDSLYKGMFVKTNMFNEKPEFFAIVNDKQLRIQKAGQLLAVAILASSEDIKSAREIYHKNIFDYTVKTVLDEELARYDAHIAREIVRK